MAKLSLCMIVKNEEKNLFRCLTSVKSVVDEIIIVDTGSTDKTIEIAKNFNSIIYHFKWGNDFSEARNFALSKCSGDWILYLDADEELNEQSQQEILRLINGKPAAVNCTIESIAEESTSGSVIRYPRLFVNRHGIKFEGKVHEQIDKSLKQNNIPIINSKIVIFHHGYAINKQELDRKKERNLNLMLNDREASNDFYYKLKIAETLISLNRYNEAEDRLLSIIADHQNTDKQISLACYSLASVYYEKNDLNRSLKFALKSYQNLKEKSELNYLLYLIYLRQGSLPESLKYLKRTVQQNIIVLRSKENFHSQNILEPIDLYLRAINLTLIMDNVSEVKKLINEFSKFVTDKSKIDESLVKFTLEKLFNENECPDDYLYIISEIFSINHMSILSEIIINSKNKIAKQNLLLQLIKIFPESAALYKTLALLTSETDKQEAIKYFYKSLALNIDPSIYIHLISIYLSTNEYIKVRECFEKLYTGYSDNLSIAPKIKLLQEKLTPILT